MAEERRPLDAQLPTLVGKPEEEATAWWKARFEQIAAITVPTARAGALVPEWRELQALPPAQRLALTRARVLGFDQLATEQRDLVLEARAIGTAQVPQVGNDDLVYIRDQVVPTLSPDLAQRMRVQIAAIEREQR